MFPGASKSTPFSLVANKNKQQHLQKPFINIYALCVRSCSRIEIHTLSIRSGACRLYVEVDRWSSVRSVRKNRRIKARLKCRHIAPFRPNSDMNLRVLRRSSFYVSDGDADVIVIIIAVAVTVDILARSFTCGLARDTTR